MGRSHPPLQLIASEANGARWPSRSSKSVAPRSRGEAGFDSQALPPAFAGMIVRQRRLGKPASVFTRRLSRRSCEAAKADDLSPPSQTKRDENHLRVGKIF